MPLTLKQIEAFRAVMTDGGMTRAAAALGVSQPAVSRLMADLEAAAGFPLFVKEGRAAVPTPRAWLLLAEVERTFLGLSHLEGVARTLRDGSGGRLSIALPPAILPLVTEQLFAPFTRLHPDAALAVEVIASFQSVAPAVFRQHDLCVTFEPLDLDGFEATPVGEMRAVCLAPAGHILTRRTGPVGLADLTDLAGERFISFWPNSAFRIEIDRMFDAAGLTRDLRCEARTTAAVCELVAAMGGVSIVPVAGPDIRADTRLAVLELDGAPVSSVRILRPAGPMSALTQAFMAFARAQPAVESMSVSAPT
jgi:DNA-binding transcriptional LysR family regulator